MKNVLLATTLALAIAGSTRTAHAECSCVAVAGDVAAAVQAEVAKADSLYVRGDFDGALALYAKAYATSKDGALLYAQGMAELQLGAKAKAKALFEQYVSIGGVYADSAKAQLGILGGTAAAVTKPVGGLVGDLGGTVRGTGDTVGGVAATGVGVTGGVVAGVHGDVKGKAKVGHKAAVALGVIAVVALGAVAIHGIAAAAKDDIELDPKFDLGMGLAGVSVGISAIYVAGLTAATGAAAGAPCLGMEARNAKPIGLAAGITF
jgi:hypothetical protein